MWLVAGDCFLIGLAPVLVHMSKGPDGKFPFHPVSINLLVEATKTVFATIVIMIYVRSQRPGTHPLQDRRLREGAAMRHSCSSMRAVVCPAVLSLSLLVAAPILAAACSCTLAATTLTAGAGRGCRPFKSKAWLAMHIRHTTCTNRLMEAWDPGRRVWCCRAWQSYSTVR